MDSAGRLVTHATIDRLPAGVLFIAPDGTLLDINHAGLALVEAESAEDALGRSLFSLVAPEFRDAVCALTERVCQGEFGSLEFQIAGLNGAPRMLEIRAAPAPGVQADRTVMLGVVVDITERRRAEEAMRESEERFRTLVQATAEVVYRTDSRGEPLGENSSWRRFTGQSQQEIESGRWLDAVHPDDRAAVWQEVSRALVEGVPYWLENRLRRHDGEWRHVLVRGAPIRRADGSIHEWVGYCQDITDRKRMEAALAASEKRFRNLMEQAVDGIFLISADQRFLEANSPGLRLLGCTREELPALRVQDFIAPAEWPRFAAGFARIFAGETLWLGEWEGVRRDGTTFSAEVSSSSLGGTGVVAIVRDVTEPKRAEETLRDTQARLLLSVRAANVGLWDWDLRSNEVYFSPEWKSQLGYREDEVPNRFEEWQNRVHAEDIGPTLEKIRAFLAHPQRKHEVEFRMRHKDGSYRWIYTQADVVCDAVGKAVRMLGCHLDITERKRAEEDMRRSRAELRALAARLQRAQEDERTRIARELHDEIGQLLTAVKLEMAGIAAKLRGSHQDLREEIAAVSALIDSSIVNVREIAAGLRTGLLDMLGLEAAIERQVQDFQALTGIACSLSLPTPPLRLDDASATALFRILQEALTNAGRHSQARHVYVSLFCAVGSIVLRISDDGRGIGHLERAGKPSLGIAGMRERALALSGELDIVEEPGGGTTVRVALPLAPPASEKQPV